MHLACKDQANSFPFLQLSILFFGSTETVFIGVIMNCQRSKTAE